MTGLMSAMTAKVIAGLSYLHTKADFSGMGADGSVMVIFWECMAALLATRGIILMPS